MRNRPAFIKVKARVELLELSQEQRERLTPDDVKGILSEEELEEYKNFQRGIKKILVRDFLTIRRDQEINLMVDKLLLSSAAISQAEARLAAEKIFENRDLKSKAM